jgi:uncharacterized protein (DUF2164 family)
MPITLSHEAEARLLKSIKRYSREQLGDDIGDLKARLLLDFCVREIGPSIYNIAVREVQARMQTKVADLDGECFEAEFGYWKK